MQYTRYPNAGSEGEEFLRACWSVKHAPIALAKVKEPCLAGHRMRTEGAFIYRVAGSDFKGRVNQIPSATKYIQL